MGGRKKNMRQRCVNKKFLEKRKNLFKKCLTFIIDGYQIPIPLVNIGGTNEKGRKLSATLMTQSLNHVPVASSKLAEWYRRLTQSIKNQGQFEQGF